MADSNTTGATITAYGAGAGNGGSAIGKCEVKLMPDKPDTTADFGVSGPVNGMGESDLSGVYILITVTPKGADPIQYRVSLGGAEVFAAELMGALHGAQNV